MAEERKIAPALARAGKSAVRMLKVAVRVILGVGFVALVLVIPLPIMPFRAKQVPLPANRDEQGEVLKKD